MANEQETRELEPIIFYREHCGKPNPTTLDEIVKLVFLNEIAWTEWNWTNTRCDLRCFIDFKDNFTPAATIVENESDRCWEWVKCRKCIKEQGITFTLLDCKDDTTFANRLWFMSLLAWLNYELDPTTNSYIKVNDQDSRECKFIDLMKFQCDPSTGLYYEVEVFYRLSVAEGTQIVKDCSKFARTQEFTNTDIELVMPRWGCSYEQRFNSDVIEDFIATYCNKTPAELLAQENNSQAPVALSTKWWSSTDQINTTLDKAKEEESKQTEEKSKKKDK